MFSRNCQGKVMHGRVVKLTKPSPLVATCCRFPAKNKMIHECLFWVWRSQGLNSSERQSLKNTYILWRIQMQNKILICNKFIVWCSLRCFYQWTQTNSDFSKLTSTYKTLWNLDTVSLNTQVEKVETQTMC